MLLIRLDAEIDDEIGAIYGDPTRLQQVVGNLLTNAVKFTGRGGRIAVRLARDAGRAQITVGDNGIGIRFIRRLRALPPEEGSRIPAAAVTALAGDEDRKRVLRSGFQMHVAKPVDAARLAAAVHALAAWSQPIVQPAPDGA